MPDLECKLEKEKQRVDNLIRELNEDKLETKQSLERIEKNLNSLVEKQIKQQGFIGGVVFAVSAVVSGLTWWFNNK